MDLVKKLYYLLWEYAPKSSVKCILFDFMPTQMKDFGYSFSESTKRYSERKKFFLEKKFKIFCDFLIV